MLLFSRLALPIAFAVAAARPGLGQPRRPDPALGRIAADWIEPHVRFLSDPLLEGRETATRGADLAARYVASVFGTLGLKPLGRDGGYLSPVPLRQSRVIPSRTSAAFTTAAGTKSLEYGVDYLVHADKTREQVELTGRVVFVGWGVTVPERGYDDYAGLDARGKIVAMVFGGPASVPPDERGHYAGLAEKERNARAHGAIGVITLLPAPGPTLANKLGQLEGYSWLGPDGVPRSLFFEAGMAIRLTDRGTDQLLAAAGRTLPEVLGALAKGPASFPIEATLSVRAEFSQRQVSSPNVVGLLRGGDPKLANEYLIYSAHLDHVGLGTPVEGDSVYHGAIDNAGGTAVLMALARAYIELPRPKRSIVFLAVTGEEKGILGSDYFIHNPPIDPGAIAANVNLDNFLMINPVEDFVAYGAEYSTVGDEVARAFARLGVRSSEDPLPWMTIFTRSDHYPFMRMGVPGVMLFPGKASGDGQRDGSAAQRAWFDTIHHTPRDRIDQPIDWGAGVRYAEANLMIGLGIANAPTRPSWRGRPFFLETDHRPATP
jgi:hypothetical protein